VSERELVEAYSNGRISRRVFVRRLLAGGVSLATALGYARVLGAGSGGSDVRLTAGAATHTHTHTHGPHSPSMPGTTNVTVVTVAPTPDDPGDPGDPGAVLSTNDQRTPGSIPKTG
jgi:hypothetical protein